MHLAVEFDLNLELNAKIIPLNAQAKCIPHFIQFVFVSSSFCCASIIAVFPLQVIAIESFSIGSFFRLCFVTTKRYVQVKIDDMCGCDFLDGIAKPADVSNTDVSLFMLAF